MKGHEGTMTTIRTNRSAIKALCLAVGLAGLMAPTGALAQKSGSVSLNIQAKKTLLVFPADVPASAGTAAPDMSLLVADMASSRFLASNVYSVTVYHKSLPQVARLRNDQQLSEVDATAPFAEDSRKAIKIAKLIGYDTVCITSVDDYQYDDNEKSVALTMSGRVIDVETGKIVKNVTLSGGSSKGGKAKEDEKAVEATRATGEKLLSQIAPAPVQVANVQKPTVDTPRVEKRRKGGSDWLWVLLAVGAGVGLGLSGHGGSGGGTDTPPPPPQQ